MSFCQNSEDFHAPMFTLLLMTVCFLHGILSSYKCPCGLCRWAERFNVTSNQPMLCSIARWLLARSGQCCMERTLDISRLESSLVRSMRAPRINGRRALFSWSHAQSFHSDLTVCKLSLIYIELSVTVKI